MTKSMECFTTVTLRVDVIFLFGSIAPPSSGSSSVVPVKVFNQYQAQRTKIVANMGPVLVVYSVELHGGGCASGVEPASCYLTVAGLFPLHVKASLGRIMNPQTAPDALVGALRGSHHHQRVNVELL